MDEILFREIPGYNQYAVDETGIVISIIRQKQLSVFELDGYLVVNTFRGSKTITLPIHRAVALAWVENLNPDILTVVNHKDGNCKNNHKSNLEWTTYSGNNYHAVNSGLRTDNIPCKIRNFYTKEILEFPSIAQACEYMGLSKDTHVVALKPKMFGKLIAGKFEFKYSTDDSEWFYEKRTELVPPSRYQILVKRPCGTTDELYSNISFIRKYELWGSAGKSIPALVDYANSLYPTYSFTYIDGYEKEIKKTIREVKKSIAIQVAAIKDGAMLNFKSITACAKHFNVDRSAIFSRLNNGKVLNGWSFIQCLFE